VPGHGGHYEVSSHGRVRERAPGVAVPRLRSPGYPTVALKAGPKHVATFVHLLVLAAFRGPRPEGHVAGVVNGNWSDVRLENLGWVTNRVLRMRNNARSRKAHSLPVPRFTLRTRPADDQRSY
jgi:hypothetical protein